MDIELGDCPKTAIKFTEEDDEGGRIGFGELPNGNIIMVTIDMDGEGIVAIMTNDQAFSLNAALERFEAGYTSETLSISADGFTDREANLDE